MFSLQAARFVDAPRAELEPAEDAEDAVQHAG
jgi:hypothetical protein